MTMPRQALKGSTYLVTKRCIERRCLIVPRDKVPDILAYCLTNAANTHGIDIHTIATMGNHTHSLVTDTEGKIDEYLRDAHSTSGRALNCYLGRAGPLWSSEQTSLVRLEDPEEVLEKLVYCIVNPVKANLVEKPEQWPGFKTLPAHLTQAPKQQKRPDTAYFKRSKLAQEASLTLTVPPQFAHMKPAEFQALLQEKVNARVAELREERRREGKQVLGARAVLRTSRETRGTSKEEHGARNPTLASKNKKRRIERLQALGLFRSEYREAYRRYRAGERDVVFPAGTLLMVRRHGVRCEAEPP